MNSKLKKWIFIYKNGYIDTMILFILEKFFEPTWIFFWIRPESFLEKLEGLYPKVEKIFECTW